METENINAMISSYERIEGEYSFKEFLKSANIKSGTYACISELLKRVKAAITVNLTVEEIKTLNYFWEIYLETEGTSPIRETMKVSELEDIFGDLWRKKPVEKNRGDSKDSEEPTPFWTSNKVIAEFWNDNNRKQVETYHDISDYLNKETKLSFEMPSNINDDDIRESIYGFFKLVDEIEDNTVRKQLVDFVCSFRSIISTKGLIQTKSIEPLINDEVVPRQIARFFVLKVKNIFFKGNHAIEKRKEKNGNSIPFSYEEIRTLSQQDNAKYADIINKIINASLKENGKPVYFWTNLTKFLNILRLLRNGKAHYLQEAVEEGEQLPVACFILHTYVGTYLSIKKNLQNLDALSEPLDYEELGVKTLTVYFNGELKKEVADIEYIKDILRPKLYRLKEEMPINEAEGYLEYRIERGEDYILRCGEGKNAVEDKVPSELFWNSASTNPVAIWDGVTCHFYPDVSTMSSELNPLVQTAQKKDLEKIVHLLKQVESHQEGIEKGIDELGPIRETLALALKRLEDLPDKIERGFEQAHKDAKEQKNILKGIYKSLKVIGWFSAAVIVAVVIAGIIYYVWPKESPVALIAKGDQYLKDGDAEKAGITYKKAIKAYEDILSNDSMNIDANIGLATMLMRGKGSYDLDRAEQCAKRSSYNPDCKRGEGLYVYLLTRNGKEEEASSYLLQKLYTPKDEYAVLADAVLTVYGYNGQLTLEKAEKAISTMETMNLLEAKGELATLQGIGVKDKETEDHYLIKPKVIPGAHLLYKLAADSLCPIAMTTLSEFYRKFGDIDMFLNWGIRAFNCGVDQMAPALRVNILQSVDIGESDEHFQLFFDTVTAISGKQSSHSSAIADFIQEFIKYNQNSNKVSTARLLKDLGELISSLEEEKDDFYQAALDNLCHLQVTLCLLDNDLQEATRLAMKLDQCVDSIAVHDYLLGVCYAKGYGDYEENQKLSDSLISVAADRGYVEAVYTRLKRNTPAGRWFVEETESENSKSETHKDAKPAVLKGLKSSESASAEVSQVKSKESKKSENIKQPSLDDEHPKIVLGVASVLSVRQWTFYVSQNANVPDSIWKNSNKLALALDDYWYSFYYKRHKDSPYLKYCSKEYQILCDVIETAFDLDSLSTVKKLPKETFSRLLDDLEIGISLALDHDSWRMARQLVTLSLDLCIKSGIGNPYIKEYEFFAWMEYRQRQRIKLYLHQDYPLYAY